MNYGVEIGRKGLRAVTSGKNFNRLMKEVSIIYYVRVLSKFLRYYCQCNQEEKIQCHLHHMRDIFISNSA